MRKRKTLLDRVRAVEKRMEEITSTVQQMGKVLPYMKDAILMMKVLMEKGIVTREELEAEYKKLT